MKYVVAIIAVLVTAHSFGMQDQEVAALVNQNEINKQFAEQVALLIKELQESKVQKEQLLEELKRKDAQIAQLPAFIYCGNNISKGGSLSSDSSLSSESDSLPSELLSSGSISIPIPNSLILHSLKSSVLPFM